MAELKQIVSTDKSGDMPTFTVADETTKYNETNSDLDKAYDNPGFKNESEAASIKKHSIADSYESTKDVPNHYLQTISDIEDEQENSTCCSRFVAKVQGGISSFVNKQQVLIWRTIYFVLIVGYFVYFALAMRYKFGDEGSWRLMIITIVASLALLYHMIRTWRRSGRGDVESPEEVHTESRWLTVLLRKATVLRINVFLPVLLVLGFIIYVALEVARDRPENLLSLAGAAVFILLFFIFSYNPSKVKWQPVFWGIALQVIFALLILRTSWGHATFQWLGDRVTEFLVYTNAGSKFVFGELYLNHPFAFQVIPIVIFFSTFVSILYYLGVMQFVIKQLGRFLAFCLGTSPTESINASGNIFIGQTEAPLLIRPFLEDMTNSELHAVMSGGFATIAGSVMAAYIHYDVPANHLLTASVMSAPAALALAKLFYPETEKSRHTPEEVYNIAKSSERNLIEAASNGASMSIPLVANIAVNLIAFVALLDFVNATLVWLGDRVGIEDFTFQFICSYLFWPLAFLMGVEQDDCRAMGALVGTKTFLNEFVAYIDLSVYIKNRETFEEYLANATMNVTGNLTGAWSYQGGDIYLNDTGVILQKGLVSVRTVVIATYSLCGFSNLSSMGIQLGGLGALAPSRKTDMTRIVFRAMLCGNVACFLTACIAGLLYEEM